MTTMTQPPAKRQPGGPGIGQWLLGTVALLLGLAAGGIGLSFNYSFGMQTGFICAAIFVLLDIGKLSIPFMGKMFGWGFGYGRAFNVPAYLTCLIVSLTCAGFHLTQDRAQERLDIAQEETRLAGANADLTATRRDLAAISEVGAAEALEAQLASAKTLVGDAEKVAKEAGITCAQRTKCVAATAARDRLVERLGLAKQRDRLQAVLDAAKDEASNAKPKALGAADDIAGMTGISKASAAIGLSLFLTLIQLVGLEVFAAFPGMAAAIFRDAMDSRQAVQPVTKPAKPAARARIAPVAPVEPQTPKGRTLLKVQLMCWNAPGGVLVTSKAALFQALTDGGLAIKRTAFYDWCKEWEASDEIEVKSIGKRGSEIRARRIAA